MADSETSGYRPRKPSTGSGAATVKPTVTPAPPASSQGSYKPSWSGGSSSSSSSGGGGGSSSYQTGREYNNAAAEQARREAEQRAAAEAQRIAAEQARAAQEAAAREAAARRAAELRAQKEAEQRAAAEAAAREAERQRQEQLRIRAQQASTQATNEAAQNEIQQAVQREYEEPAVQAAQDNVTQIENMLAQARQRGNADDILRLTEDLFAARDRLEYVKPQTSYTAQTQSAPARTNPLATQQTPVQETTAQPAITGSYEALVRNYDNPFLSSSNSRSNAFVKNAGRTPQEEEEEFYNPRLNGYLRAEERTQDIRNSGNEMLFPTDYGGTTIPGMPASSLPTVTREPVTQNQFLNAVNNPFAVTPNAQPTSVMLNNQPAASPANNGYVSTAYLRENPGESPAATQNNGYVPTTYLRENPSESSMLFPTDYGGTTIPDMPAVSAPRITRDDFLNAVPNPFAYPDLSNQEVAAAGVSSFPDIITDTGYNPNNLPYSPFNNLFQNTLNGIVNLINGYGQRVQEYNNDLSDIPSQDPYANVTPIASEHMDTQGRIDSGYYNARENMYNAMVQNQDRQGYENALRQQMYEETWENLNQYNNPLSQLSAVLGETDRANELNTIAGQLPENWSSQQRDQYLQRVMDAEGNIHAPNALADQRYMPAPEVDENGNGNVMFNQIMNSIDYLDSNGMGLYRDPDGTLWQPVVDANGNVTRRKYTGEIEEKYHYTPDTILSMYVNSNGGRNGEPVWREPVQEVLNDPTLSEEERAGLNALLDSFISGGDPNRLREGFGREFFDGTEAQYERFAQLFFDRMPALKRLVEAGALSENDIANFFFKALPGSDSSGSSGSGSGSGNSYSRRSYGGRGYGYRSYGGGGSSRAYARSASTPSLTANSQRSNYSSPSSTPQYASQRASVVPAAASQRSNRVYNIMKNWSF